MARLTYPTRADLLARLTDGDGAERIDPYSVAKRDGDRLTVQLALPAPGSAVVRLIGSPGRWDIAPLGKGASAAVTLPEPILARANRLMQAEGVSIQRDWRTKTHVLRAAPRRVLPLTWGDSASAVLTRTGWVATPTASAPTPISPITPPVAPSAGAEPGASLPALLTDQPAPADTAPTRGSKAPNAVQVGLPAAYAGQIVVPDDVRAVWHAARAAHRAGHPMVVAMVGPSGAGKTHAVHSLSAEEGLDVVKFDASGVIEPGDWFGTVVLDGDGTRFVPSDLLVALTLPGARTLLLDEMNRANPRALNALLPVLDGSGTVTIPQSGQRQRLNPDVQIVLTANIGSAFLAAEPLDEAVRTRVSAWNLIGHLNATDEAALLRERIAGAKRRKRPGVAEFDPSAFAYVPERLTAYYATTLAKMGAKVRQAAQNGSHPPVSTRQLLAAGHMIAAGLPARLAIDAAVLNGYSAEGGDSSERAKVLVHVTGMVWEEPTPKPGVPGAVVYTGASGTDSGPCECGHEAEAHGIGTEVSKSVHCRTCVRDYPGPHNAYRQCMSYNPPMVAVEDATE